MNENWSTQQQSGGSARVDSVPTSLGTLGKVVVLAPGASANLVHEIFSLQRAVRWVSSSTSRGEEIGSALHFVLRLVNEGECRAAELAARLGIGAPVLSRHLAELEERGLVIRRKDPDDGRALLVAITPSGLERLQQLDAQRSAAFQEHLWDWGEEDAVRAAETLHQLTLSLTKSAATGRNTRHKDYKVSVM